MKNNKIIKGFLIDSLADEEIKKICEATGLKRSALIRFLLLRSLSQMKEIAQKVGGYDNLEFSFKKMK